MSRRLLDVDAAARVLGFVDEDGTPQTKKVYRLIEAGEIAHIRCRDNVHTRVIAGERKRYRKPGRVYLLEADCDAWIDRHRVPAKSDRSSSTPRPAARSLPEIHERERRFS